MNMNILERAISMRIYVSLPLFLWANMVDTTMYLIKKSPSIALDGGIPKEAWTSKKVNYSSLIVFVCEAYAHIDKENRKKLDAKSQKCYFIGYEVDELGYRLWDVDNCKVIRSRDIIFNEKYLYKDRLHENQKEREEPKYVVLDNDEKSNPKLKIEAPPQPQPQEEEKEPKTSPTYVVIRSSRTSKIPQCFSNYVMPTRGSKLENHFYPTLHYVLYTDAGEPEYFDEAKHLST